MADDNLDYMQQEQQQSTGVSRTADRAKDEAGKQTRNAIKKAKEAQKKGKYAKGIGKVLYYILAGLIILIMCIGFIAFAINMPGAIVDKIITTIDKVSISIKQWWTQEDLSNINEEELQAKKLELLNYLENMGYDVVGMGFVRSVGKAESQDDPKKQVITSFIEEIINVDFNTTVQPSYLFSYYLANERIFVSKNVNPINAILKTTGTLSNWGEGMLNIYGAVSLVDGVDLDRENLTLTFKNMNGFFKTDVYQYNIDGWAGRYGTPLELLLALHTSTMMPDLVYEFISNENLQTVVNINTQEVKLEVGLKLVGPNGEADINIGTINDEPMPIVFKRNKDTGDYGIENKDQIINGLKEGIYSVASIKHAFDNFETTLTDFQSSIGETETNRKIAELINTTSLQIYKDSNASDLVFGRYIGTPADIDYAYNNNTRLYNDSISVDYWDGDNIIYTYHYESGETRSQQTVAYRLRALPAFENALKNDEIILQEEATSSDYPRFSENWKTRLKTEYYTIFNGIDIYFENLILGETVTQEQLNYGNGSYYVDSFNLWVDGLEAPLEFIEYIQQNDLEGASQYEKEGRYNNYKEEWAEEQVSGLNNFMQEIREDLEVQKSVSSSAKKLKEILANEIGLTSTQLDMIYDEFLVRNPEIKTFVPHIQSVIKHWYKDLVFNYKYTKKGTVFETPYPGENVPNFALFYQFKTLDENYPVQDGEPYVIKGDVVTQNGVKSDITDVPVDSQTQNLLNDYTLGQGYKTSRKLFTQGYYYQYDGSKETADEIANAKLIEAYNEGEHIKVYTKNGRITGVVRDDTGSAPSSNPIITTYKKNGNVLQSASGADTILKAFVINAPKKYVSPVDGTFEQTKESVDSINNALKSVGSDIRRKKVNIINNTASLTALSILEGMHSLDADYIYREFKEFLIDLGYYSRAEIEQVETGLLDWFIPAFTPDEWPPVKDDENMLEYGTTLLSSSNIKDKKTILIEKMSSLDNFIFLSDTDGIYDMGTLQGAGNNISYFNNGLDADSIVTRIINTKPTAICLYLDSNSKDDTNAINNTKKLLQDIRNKLKEQNYESPDIAIYVLQILPLGQPNILEEASKEVVAQNKRINDYNTSLFNVCLNLDNVKFIDATSGGVTETGWLDPRFSAQQLSTNIITKIVKKNVSNGGFIEGLDVISPGAGYVTAVEEKQITIEFSVEQDPRLRPLDGFTLIISGINVDSELRNNFISGSTLDSNGNSKYAIENGTIIGVTTTENIKLILRDKNKAIIGNIEDYIGLPKSSKSISDWELLYFLPFESGALDTPGSGTESVAMLSGTEVAVGIIQWTTKSSGMNNVANICRKLAEKDPVLCGGLEAFASWGPSETINDISSGENSEIRKAFREINSRDKETFLKLQTECMLEDYGQPPAGYEWITQKRGVVYGTYISAKLWAGNYSGIENVIYPNMSDEQLVKAIINKARDSKGNDPEYNLGWNNRVTRQIDIATRIINGEFTEDEIESLVREGY